MPPEGSQLTPGGSFPGSEAEHDHFCSASAPCPLPQAEIWKLFHPEPVFCFKKKKLKGFQTLHCWSFPLLQSLVKSIYVPRLPRFYFHTQNNAVGVSMRGAWQCQADPRCLQPRATNKAPTAEPSGARAGDEDFCSHPGPTARGAEVPPGHHLPGTARAPQGLCRNLPLIPVWFWCSFSPQRVARSCQAQCGL